MPRLQFNIYGTKNKTANKNKQLKETKTRISYSYFADKAFKGTLVNRTSLHGGSFKNCTYSAIKKNCSKHLKSTYSPIK